jgi:hypothetical protein
MILGSCKNKSNKTLKTPLVTYTKKICLDVKHTNEQLLKLLIAIVDAELLEAVRVEYLEPVDVQHSNDSASVAGPNHINGCVYLAHDPREQSVIYGLQYDHVNTMGKLNIGRKCRIMGIAITQLDYLEHNSSRWLFFSS